MMETDICLEKAALFARLLSRLYLAPPDQPLLEHLGAIDLAGIWPFTDNPPPRALDGIAQSMQGRKPDDLHGELRDDHMRLFIGPGMPQAPLWGSVYLEEENLLLGESTLALEKFLRDSGLAPLLEHREPLDNLGYIFSALASFLERQHPDNPDWTEVRELVEAHVLPWSARCLELQEQYARTPFYRSVGSLANEFLNSLAAACGARKIIRKLYY